MKRVFAGMAAALLAAVSFFPCKVSALSAQKAVLMDAQTGRVAAESVWDYPHGVMTEQGPAWALQDPEDYLAVLEHTIPAVLRERGVNPENIKAIGWDVTSCTMLPALADGTPLCRTEGFREHPHAKVKLWKHLAAAPQAKRIEELAAVEDPEACFVTTALCVPRSFPTTTAMAQVL